MPERKPISKKLRFDVFKRDFFTCQYCGATPPSVILQIDHVHPVAHGGTNDIDNLVTSCSSCNQGKGARPLNAKSKSSTLEQRAAEAQEREEQMLAYNKVLTEISNRIEDDAWQVIRILEQNPNADRYLSSRLQSIKVFLERLPAIQVFEAAQIASANFPSNSDSHFRYFCGVCWNKVRGG